MVFGSPVLVLLAIPFILAVVVATVAGTAYVYKQGNTSARWLPVVSVGIFGGSFMLALATLQGCVSAMDRAGASEYTDVPVGLVSVTSCGAEKLGEVNEYGRQRWELTFSVELDPAIVRAVTWGKLDEANSILVSVEHRFDGPSGPGSFPSTGSTRFEPGASNQTIVVRNAQGTTGDDRDNYNESPSCVVTQVFLVS